MPFQLWNAESADYRLLCSCKLEHKHHNVQIALHVHVHAHVKKLAGVCSTFKDLDFACSVEKPLNHYFLKFYK